LKRFDYITAHTVTEALKMLAENSPSALPIAGGTALLVQMKRSQAFPKTLVDIAGIQELYGIELTEEALRIGSMVSHAEIISSPLIREYVPVLADASASVGAPQTRNLGTVGGNLASLVPSMDCAPPLLALGAQVGVVQQDGYRRISLEEFFAGSERCLSTPDRLLTEILIPGASLGKASSFIKFGRRKGMSLSLVNASAFIELDEAGDRFVRVRLALGAVAPTPIRARKAEKFLEGKRIRNEILIDAGTIASEDAKPINDFRASAAYRLELVKVLTHRALNEALNRKSRL
jgi:carbon-monoxide dehydrogenase medium subunit